MQYPCPTLDRAQRAIRCSPFQPKLFETMHWQSVSLLEITGAAGVKHQYTQRPLAELRAENALLWLIQVGILRREVDGQGLTDSFRLTPLGRQLVTQGQKEWQPPAWSERIQNALTRRLRLWA